MNPSVEFFTTGDPYLIETVLNAVMLALDAGGLGAGNAIGGAMAIGILVSAINALITGEFSFNKLIAAFIVWFTMFGFSMGSSNGTRYDAVITGPNGSTAFVTDLPLGIAMPFFVLGIIGPEMNDVLTTAFALPKYVPAGDGSADSVRVPSDPYVALMNLRQWTPTQQSLNEGRDSLSSSMVNYVRDCYNASLAAKGIKEEIDSKSYTSFWQSIDTDEVPFTTEVYFELSSPGQALNSGDAPHSRDDPAQVHCDIAHQEILNQMDGTWVDSVVLDMKENGRINVDAAVALSNSTVPGSATAADLVRSEFARYVLRRAAAENSGVFSNLELSMEKARFRAMQDKNTKGAAEYSYYNENWTIMLQVFEIICYFVTVLIPFLILISGGALLKILLAWLTLVVWVNTIPITAVLSRLFVEYYASLAQTCSNPTSPACLNLQTVGGIEASYTTIETALGMGGTIAQLMPTVTLFLLTGSAYALMGAAGSAPKSSTDTSNINPKFGGVVNSDGSEVNSRGVSAELGAVSGAAFTSTNQSNASPTVKITNASQTAAQTAANQATTAGREFGNTSQSAMQNLRSTALDLSKSSESSSEKGRTVTDAVKVVDQETGAISTKIGEQVSNAEKTANRIVSGMTGYIATDLKQDTGIFGAIFGTNASVSAGAKMSLGTDYTQEDVAAFLESIGVDKTTANQLSSSEDFVNQLAETARTMDKESELLKDAFGVTNTDTDALTEAYKRGEVYSEMATSLSNTSMGVTEDISLTNSSFINSDSQEREALERIRDTGFLSQSEQLEDFLTDGMSKEQRNQVLSDFNAYAQQNDYSNKSYDERQELLDDFVTQKKEEGIDFSGGERKLDKEIGNINERFTKERMRQLEGTGIDSDRTAIQQFLLDRTSDISALEMTGDRLEDANRIRRYDDNVDMLTDFMVNPENKNYLKNTSEGYVELSNRAMGINSDGERIAADANENARVQTAADGSIESSVERDEAYDEEFEEASKSIANKGEKTKDLNVMTPEELDQKTAERQKNLLAGVEEARSFHTRNEALYSDNYTVAPYQIDMNDTYQKQTNDYLQSLPINDALTRDAQVLFQEMKSGDLESKLKEGYELLEEGKSVTDTDITPDQKSKMQAAMAYTAVQNNPSLSEFNDIAQQLTNLDRETSGLSKLDIDALGTNSELFGEKPLAEAEANSKLVADSGRYNTDFTATQKFMENVGEKYDYNADYTPVVGGGARGAGYEAPFYAIDAAKELSDGDLKGAFDTLYGSNVNGRDTQILTIAGTEMMKYGDDTQRDLGKKMVDAAEAYLVSGGDFGKFATAFNTSQDIEFGKGPTVDRDDNEITPNPYINSGSDSGGEAGSNNPYLGPFSTTGGSDTAGQGPLSDDARTSSPATTQPAGTNSVGNNPISPKEQTVARNDAEEPVSNAGQGPLSDDARTSAPATTQPAGTNSVVDNPISPKEQTVARNDVEEPLTNAGEGISSSTPPALTLGEKELTVTKNEDEQPPTEEGMNDPESDSTEQQERLFTNTFGTTNSGSNDNGNA